MEIRQLRYFTRVVELGSMGKAARDLGVVTSALSQQISRLESELSTRLLQRTATGIVPTDAGIAFFTQAQLALRHIDEASRAAQQARLSGHVNFGLAPTTASVLGLPLIYAMRERYPDVRLHLVESLSGHLATMLSARQLDLAVLFNTDPARKWSEMPLLDERVFLIAAKGFAGFPENGSLHLSELSRIPLVMPSDQHGLRAMIAAACAQQNVQLNIELEIDSLAMLMDAVGAGLVATIQPGAAVARLRGESFSMAEIVGANVVRRNFLVSLSDDELSPAGLAARVVMRDVVVQLVKEGRWSGVALADALASAS